MSNEPKVPQTQSIEDATCLACGCLCDDIVVEVDSSRVVEARNACVLGRPWFIGPRPGEGLPPLTIDGRPAELDDAIDHHAAASATMARAIARAVYAAIPATNDLFPVWAARAPG